MLALPVVLSVALVAVIVSLYETRRLHSGVGTIQSGQFVRPTTTSAVPFTLPVLETAAGARLGGSGFVSMASLRGKPVVLNMWSSSCTVCKQETPAVESVARRVGDAVEFVGIDTLDDRRRALAFLKRYGLRYLELFDPGEQVGSGYGIPGLPVTVFVSKSGRVKGEYLGALDAATLSHYLQALFGVRSPPT